MAFPVILVDSTNGAASDSAASGAGPTTAITGSAGVSAVDGLSVILDGSPNISGLATDGSHVLYFADATAGNRNFSRIVGIANSGTPTATVTLGEALGTTLTKAWAIGGVRATIGGTASLKLFSNNAGAGDALPGWIEEMQSGHIETLSASFVIRRSGDVTGGPITLRGATGAATLPVLTFSNNGAAFNPTTGITNIVLQSIELKNSNGTKTASVGVLQGSNAVAILLNNIRITASGASQFWKAVGIVAANIVIVNSEFANCAGACITSTSAGTIAIRYCYIHDNAGNGISLSSTGPGPIVDNCIFANNTGDDINDARTPSVQTIGPITIEKCVFYGGSADGYECTVTNAQTSLVTAIIENNIFSNKGGYGINLSGTGGNDIQCNAHIVRIRNNCFFSNTSGKYNGMTVAISSGEQTVDPQFVNAAGGNFAIGANLKALGFPTINIGNGSSTRSYVDIGAAQRQEPSAGGLILQRGFNGGIPG